MYIPLKNLSCDSYFRDRLTVVKSTALTVKNSDVVHMLKRIQCTHFSLQRSGFILAMAVINENELEKVENQMARVVFGMLIFLEMSGMLIFSAPN